MTKERAIIAAVNAATTHPPAEGVNGDLALVGIENVRAQRMSRSAALRGIGPAAKHLPGGEGGADLVRDMRDGTPVWLVTLAGPTFATTHSAMDGDRNDRALHAVIVDTKVGGATAIASAPERNASQILRHTQRYRAPGECTRHLQGSAPASIFVRRGPARIGDTSRGYSVVRESNAFPLFRSAAGAVLARLDPPRGATAASGVEEERIAESGTGLGLHRWRRNPSSGEYQFAWTTIPAYGGEVYARGYDGRRSIRAIPDRASREMTALRALLDPPRLEDRVDARDNGR